MTSRIFYMDNLRYLIVLMVVVLHTACGYTNHSNWWPVNDDNSPFFDSLILFFDVFLMPSLFFIAGYFALPSLNKKNGTWFFIKSKLKRLGIPWLAGCFLFVPIHLYIYDYTRGGEMGLEECFFKTTSSFFLFHTGNATPSNPYQFNQYHFWFISLLLFFFIIFAFLVKFKRQFFPKTYSMGTQNSPPSNKSILIAISSIGIISALISLVMSGIFAQGDDKSPWVMIFSFIQFQPTNIALYILSFSLGIYAFHKKWFLDDRVPGHLYLWIILSFLLWYVRETAITQFFDTGSMKFAILFVFIHPFLFFTILLSLISFGLKNWQSNSPINKSLANNSYNIYLIHMFFVYISQLFLFSFWENGFIFTKFALAGITSIFISYIVSNYFFQKAPKLFLLTVTVLFVFFATVTKSVT